jgi:hypothetical protein
MGKWHNAAVVLFLAFVAIWASNHIAVVKRITG